MPAVNPTLPAVGGGRGTEELTELAALTAIRDAINGTLDAGNLVPGIFAPYTTLLEVAGGLTSADGGVDRLFTSDGTPSNPAGVSTPKVNALSVPSPSPWALTGRTPKMRLVLAVACNNVEPNVFPGITQIEVLLYAVTVGGTAGSLFLSLAGVVSPLVGVVPSQATFVEGESADFDVPAAGLYVPIFTISGSIATGASLRVNCRIELHHV